MTFFFVQAYQGQDCSNGAQLCEIDNGPSVTNMTCVSWTDSNYGELSTCEDCNQGVSTVLQDSNGQPQDYICPVEEEISNNQEDKAIKISAFLGIIIMLTYQFW